MQNMISEIRKGSDMIKIIKNEEDYKKCLERAGHLVSLDPKVGSPEADELEVLSVLINKYEEEHYFIGKPTPIEAIIFRMEQQDLKQRDLVPFIGSKSKVSEVLSGKRPLSLEVIRSLNKNFDIPIEVLAQEDKGDMAPQTIWEKFPIKEMYRRGWFDNFREDYRVKIKEAITAFFEPIKEDMLVNALFRRTVHERSGKEIDKYAISAWLGAIIKKAYKDAPRKKFDKNNITEEFLKEVVKLSRFDDGPLRAKKFLADHGVVLVVEPLLPKTKVDGCALLSKRGFAVVGLTIRYDRLDNFWFTLMHELAHVKLHLDNSEGIFVDNLDVDTGIDRYEKEADKFASNCLISKAEWMCGRARREHSPEAIRELSNRLGIHTAIIAGRIRSENNNYSILSQFVGHGKVRELFVNVNCR